MRKLAGVQGLTKSHVRILSFLLANPSASFTQLELAKQLGMEKSYKNVREAVQVLAEQGVISKKEVGASVLCSLDFRSQKTLDYAAYIDSARKYWLFKAAPHVQELCEKLVEAVKLHTPFFILLLFGSYAKGNFHEKSDVDIVVIAEKKHREGMERELVSLPAIYSIKLNLFIMSQADYEGMLKGREPVNVGKESLKDHVLLYGTELYYQIVRSALW